MGIAQENRNLSDYKTISSLVPWFFREKSVVIKKLCSKNNILLLCITVQSVSGPAKPQPKQFNAKDAKVAGETKVEDQYDELPFLIINPL